MLEKRLEKFPDGSEWKIIIVDISMIILHETACSKMGSQMATPEKLGLGKTKLKREYLKKKCFLTKSLL